MCYSQIVPEMKQEIEIAVDFLMKVVRLNHNSRFLAPGQITVLREKMSEVLQSKYINHWFPEFPTRGSGYRCIRINGHLDPLVSKAGELSGVSFDLLRSLFPPELTLWVDPRDVAYRFGENGSVCPLLTPPKSNTNAPNSPFTANDGEVFCDPSGIDGFESVHGQSPKYRTSPTDYLLRSGKRTPPASPVGSPYNYMNVARSKKSAFAQKLEFTHNAKNINHLGPLTAYMC
jgi:protein Tob/BTG